MAFTLSSRGRVIGVTELDLVRIGRHWAGWLHPNRESERLMPGLVGAWASWDLRCPELHRGDGTKVHSVRLAIRDVGPVRRLARPIASIVGRRPTRRDPYFIDDSGCVVAFDEDVDDEYEFRPQDEAKVFEVLETRASERARDFGVTALGADRSAAPRYQIYVELVNGEWPQLLRGTQQRRR